MVTSIKPNTFYVRAIDEGTKGYVFIKEKSLEDGLWKGYIRFGDDTSIVYYTDDGERVAPRRLPELDLLDVKEFDATFMYFKPSNKFYTKGEGIFPVELFEPTWVGPNKARTIVTKVHDGQLPGLMTAGEGLTVVITPEKDCPFGWPIMLPARSFR